MPTVRPAAIGVAGVLSRGWNASLEPVDATVTPHSLLAAFRHGQVSWPQTTMDPRRLTHARVHIILNQPSSQRPGNDNHLLVQSLSPVASSPLLTLTRRIADCGCNLADARVSTLGDDISLVLLARGPWDAIAKLESALGRLARDEALHLAWYRSQPRTVQSHLLPYVVEVISADRNGVLAEVVEFFSQRGISVEQLTSMRYQAMQTGADMFQAQITIGIPANNHIAALRDDFLELCDSLNLDAIMDPVKF